jgi:hypothetical protein
MSWPVSLAGCANKPDARKRHNQTDDFFIAPIVAMIVATILPFAN